MPRESQPSHVGHGTRPQVRVDPKTGHAWTLVEIHGSTVTISRGEHRRVSFATWICWDRAEEQIDG